MKRDPTMDPVSAYGSERWSAARLGLSWETFRRRRDALEAEGFPKRDAIVGLRVKADVDAWIAKRRKIADARSATTTAPTHSEVDYGSV